MVRLTRIIPGMILALSLQASPVTNAGCSFVYRQSGSHVRVSLESYQTRQGWTPVRIVLAGAEVEAMMDGQGRVYGTQSVRRGDRGEPCFRIDLAGNLLLTGEAAIPLQIYERNAMRTRFWLAEETVELPLQWDGKNLEGTLYLGRLGISSRIGNQGSETDSPASLLKRKPPAGGERQPPEALARLFSGRIRPRFR